MALKAGRVGVAPDQVDEFGQVKSEATSGYTKQEADSKFETKTEAEAALAEKQPIILEVPIEMLSGTKLTVESALQGLNDAFTEVTTLQESACTNIISGGTVNKNHIVKYGKVVFLLLEIAGITATAHAEIAKIPDGFIPKYLVELITSGTDKAYIGSSGSLAARQNMTDKTLIFSGTWITS